MNRDHSRREQTEIHLAKFPPAVLAKTAYFFSAACIISTCSYKTRIYKYIAYEYLSSFNSNFSIIKILDTCPMIN